MVVGILLGYLFPDRPAGQSGFQATDLQVLSTIFLRMIKSLIVPLLFATLVVGIAGHGDDMKRVGKLAFRSIVYFEIVTTLALVVGLARGEHREARRGREPRRRDRRSRHRARAHADDARRRARAHRAAELLRGGARRTRCCRSSSSRSSSPSRCRRCRGRPKTFMLVVLREPERGDVQVRRDRDEVRADRHRRGDRGHRRQERARACCSNLGVLVLTLYGALIVFVLFVLAADRARVHGPAPPLLAGGEGAVAHRVHDGVVRGGAAARAAAHGAARRAAAHRLVRAADRLLVQPRRHHALSRARVGVRRAGRGHRHADRRRRS